MLALIPVKNFDEAIEVANNTEYGLTGAVYSKACKKIIEQAKQEFFVGNLYINRKMHRRDGWRASVSADHNMSGTDSKAGGYDYSFHFNASQEHCREEYDSEEERKRKDCEEEKIKFTG